MVLVSVDDHVVEPPDLFKDRLPKKYVDLAPQFLTKEDGTNVWSYEGTEVGNVALNAVAGRPKDEYGIEPTSFSDIRPGCYDVNERVKDMNANGVLGALCFPSFPQFCGQLFARTDDKDVALAMIQAYNDWHIDEWCGSNPGRFIPLALPAIWDPETLAAEVRARRPRVPTPSPFPRTRRSWAGPACTRTTGTPSGRPVATRASWPACTSVRLRKWSSRRRTRPSTASSR